MTKNQRVELLELAKAVTDKNNSVKYYSKDAVSDCQDVLNSFSKLVSLFSKYTGNKEYSADYNRAVWALKPGARNIKESVGIMAGALDFMIRWLESE